MGRYIKKEVNDRLMIRDYFRCVWCGTHLYDRHHILEFHLGGEHSLENLALLCPNCHRLIHRGIINPLDLLNRCASQKKGDRLNGMVEFGISEPITISFGSSCKTIDCPIPLQFKETPLISYSLSGANEFLLSCRLFDRSGNLILWMHDNSFWTTSEYKCTLENGRLVVRSAVEDPFIELTRVDENSVKLLCINYLGGLKVDVTEEHCRFGTNTIQGNLHGGAIGIMLG